MAYMNQAKKAAIAPKVKAILKKYGLKGSLAVDNYSTLVLNIRSGKIDFQKDAVGEFHHQINHYWAHEHFSGKAKKFFSEVIPAMNNGNHDNSDSMTDYFDVGWYVDINVGRWDRPYEVTN
jgi:hypothetical protein